MLRRCVYPALGLMTGSENTQEKVGVGKVSLPDLCLAERVCVIPDKMTKETAKIFRYFIFLSFRKTVFRQI